MSRRFLDLVRTDLTTLLVTGGNTPAPPLADLLVDVIDSTINDECVIFGQIAANTNLTTTFTPIINAYTEDIGGDGDFLKPSFVAGQVQSSTTPGFSYDISGKIGFVAQNNVDYEFVLMRNGVAVGFIDAQTGTGNSDNQTANIDSVDLSAPADAIYQIGARVVVGTATITINQILLLLEIKPTNNAT